MEDASGRHTFLLGQMPRVLKDRTSSNGALLTEESPKLNTPNKEFIWSNNICDRQQQDAR